MGKQYSIAEARDQLARVVHEVEGGSAVALTRRGKPVAAIVSMEDYRRLSAARSGFWDSVERLRASPDFEPIEDDWLEGVRDRSPGRDFHW